MTFWKKWFSAPNPAPTPPNPQPALAVQLPTPTPVAPVPAKARQLVDKPAEIHASRFLQHLREDDDAPFDVLASDLMPLYEDFCAEMGWRELHWNVVAPHLKKLLGGKKSYLWLNEGGVRRRLRVYHISEAATAPNVVELRMA